MRSYFITVALLLAPTSALACACGCGVFEVSTGSMLPTGEGGMAFLEYNFMNQNKNWHNVSHAPAADNDDKDLKSMFLTAGVQYMWNREWGGEIDVPFTRRHFVTAESGAPESFDHSAVGDVRIKGIYSGFSSDMSSGVTFGLKLPTGNYTFHGFDRDTAIGSGSTDLLLGAYHMDKLGRQWNWFADAQLDQPFLTTAGYRPGTEADAAAGIYYDGWNIGKVKIAPVGQVIGAWRLHDRGINASPDDSGYTRLLLSPGIEADFGKWSAYADVEFPVYENVRGNQLVAPELVKLVVSYKF